MRDETPLPPAVLGTLCIDCRDPAALAAWWQSLIGGELNVDDDGDVRLTGGALPLLFLKVPEQKQVKNRLHLDLRVHDFDEAVTAALALGAQPADEIYVGERWRVLRDPEGNEFCLIRPWNVE